MEENFKSAGLCGSEKREIGRPLGPEASITCRLLALGDGFFP
jgi:hypothetical protein